MSCDFFPRDQISSHVNEMVFPRMFNTESPKNNFGTEFLNAVSFALVSREI